MEHSPNFIEERGRVAVIRPRRWFLWLLIVFVVFVVMAWMIVSSIRTGLEAWELAEQGKVTLEVAQTRGAALDFRGADAALAKAAANFEGAGVLLAELGVLRGLPWVGTQIRATEETLAVGIQTIAAVREVLAFGDDLAVVMQDISSARAFLTPELPPTLAFRDLTSTEKRLLLARFLASVPKLEAAQEVVNSAFVRFEQIPTDGLAGPLRRAILPVAAGLPRLAQDLDRAIPLAKLLPAFAGYPAPKDTLILFLNNAELRPGGGFVGTVGRTRIQDATIEFLTTMDAYAIDRPAEAFLDLSPPAPLIQYLGLERWFMRDANWSPDFARSAELVAHFYEREVSGGEPIEQIDNVIAFTPTFASELLRLTGPILVQSQTFQADNLFDLLEYQVERGFREQGLPFNQRKEILAELVQATLDALLDLPAARLEDVLAVIDRGFRSKQLLLYDRDPAVQAEIETGGWGGRVRPGDGDFLMVVDANLGSLKSDPVVSRRLDYSIVPDDDDFLATVAVTYRHEGYFDWKTTRYRTYTRLYVPEGSEFVSAEGTLKDDKIKNPTRDLGEVTVAPDSEIPGTITFGAFTAVEPGEERTLSFTYRLAPQVVRAIKRGEYQLRAQKQLGALAHELTLDLDFGKTGDEPYQARTDLSIDRRFTVNF